MNSIYEKRLQFYINTVSCQRCDRVMVAPMIMYLPIHLYGKTTVQAVMENYANAEDSFLCYHREYQPDLAWGPQSIFPSPALDVLGCQFLKWPGKHFKDPNAGYQVLDTEKGYMSQEEYLEYAEDPSGFMMKKILPRMWSKLNGLSKLDFSNAVWQGAAYGCIPLLDPEVQETLKAMRTAGERMLPVAMAGGKIMQTLAKEGWPGANDMSFAVPFDLFNDNLRGFINTSMDMLECPDELLTAVEASTRIQVRGIRNTFAQNPHIRSVTFFVHNGMDMFMSREQFETFYWPGFKKCIDTVVELGGIPHLYLEDNYDSKMDILARDLPAKKCIVTPVNSNLERTKELFADKICIAYGIDGALLKYGTKEDVTKNVKHAIDILAPGGGCILDGDVCLDVAEPENLRTLFDTAMNYMKY